MFPSREPSVSGNFCGRIKGSCPNSAGTLRLESETQRKPEVPASPRGEALFRCARPSGPFLALGVPILALSLLHLVCFHFHALEKEMATHSSVLAWRIPGIGDPQKSPDTPGSPEGNTEGPGTASSEPPLPS